MQPALAVACDNCRRVTDALHRHGLMTVCDGCLDPLSVLGIMPSQGRIESQQNGPEAVRQHRRSPGPRHQRTDLRGSSDD